jgi:hypothetical protein
MRTTRLVTITAWVLVFTLGVIAAAPAPARQGTVQTRQGQTLTGDVVEENGSVTVTVHGIRTQIRRQDVTSIDYSEDAQTQFNQRLDKLQPGDVRGRLELAHWAFDLRRYDLARKAIDEVLAIAPDHEEANTFLRVITQQAALERPGRPAPTEVESTTRPEPAGDATGIAHRYLSDDDINVIRQKELKPTDVVAIRFLNDVKARYMTAANVPVRQFNSQPLVRQAIEIITRGDDAMRADVRINGDPRALLNFRRQVHPMIVQGCAGAGCHGGASGGDFILFNSADNSDEVVYTNYLILQMYSRPVPIADAAGDADDLAPGRQTVVRHMIDRVTPQRSLLIQYAMPPNMAELDHPDVIGYRPLFSSWREGRLRLWMNWITNDLGPVVPDYGLTYEPPTARNSTTGPAATAPTTAPSP